ncbi:MAG: roadblock/LC7 domain-containing protein [Thermodesulfobacteriota bacterium]
MGFHEILKWMVDGVKGGYAGAIVGMDGISVQDYIKEGAACDLEAISVEYGKILGEVNKASEILKLGEVEEIDIASHGTKVLLRLITPEYFIAFILTPSGNTGKGRYFLKKAASKAGTEL